MEILLKQHLNNVNVLHYITLLNFQAAWFSISDILGLSFFSNFGLKMPVVDQILIGQQQAFSSQNC